MYAFKAESDAIMSAVAHTIQQDNGILETDYMAGVCANGSYSRFYDVSTEVKVTMNSPEQVSSCLTYALDHFSTFVKGQMHRPRAPKYHSFSIFKVVNSRKQGEFIYVLNLYQPLNAI